MNSEVALKNDTDTLLEVEIVPFNRESSTAILCRILWMGRQVEYFLSVRYVKGQMFNR